MMEQGRFVLEGEVHDGGGEVHVRARRGSCWRGRGSCGGRS